MKLECLEFCSTEKCKKVIEAILKKNSLKLAFAHLRQLKKQYSCDRMYLVKCVNGNIAGTALDNAKSSLLRIRMLLE